MQACTTTQQTWTEPQSKSLFKLRLSGVEPTSSRWSPPATDPLRVWPHEYDPSSDNQAWGMDPMGSWHDVQGNRTGPLRDTGIPEHVMNYAFMDMYDAIPCGKPYHNKLIYDATTLQERSAKRRNFYASMQYIKKYPTYHDMLGTLGISAGTFNEQVKPTIYALSHCMDYADENVRFWEWNHTELLQERVLWTNDGFPVEVDGSSDQFVAGQNHSGKYKTQVVKGDLAISLAGHPLHMNFGHFGTVHDDPLWSMGLKCVVCLK